MIPSTLPVPLLLLTTTLLIATITDLRRREIPNWLVAAASTLGLVIAVLEGRASSALFCALLAAAPFLLAALVKPEGMGMGDVKLVAVLGLYLGLTVWLALASGLALASMTGVLLSLGTRRPPSQTSLPLAPFLALGAATAVIMNLPALQ